MKAPLRVALLMVVLIGATLAGHHSFAPFNMEKTMSLTGVVKEFQWINPHSWIQLMVKDKTGKEVEWSIETGSAASLTRRGWKRTALKAGDQITVTMHPLRDGRPAGSLVDVILADGTKIGGDPAGQPNR
jgi:hypothetical protein